MNQKGGIINILVAIAIITFVLLALMNPINSLADIADEKLTTLHDTPRTSRDFNGATVQMADGGASLGNITMTLLFGLGFIFLLGLVIYIIRFGPNQPPAQPLPPPQGGYYG